jgi:hypothetical protein
MASVPLPPIDDDHRPTRTTGSLSACRDDVSVETDLFVVVVVLSLLGIVSPAPTPWAPNNDNRLCSFLLGCVKWCIDLFDFGCADDELVLRRRRRNRSTLGLEIGASAYDRPSFVRNRSSFALLLCAYATGEVPSI